MHELLEKLDARITALESKYEAALKLLKAYDAEQEKLTELYLDTQKRLDALTREVRGGKAP